MSENAPRASSSGMAAINTSGIWLKKASLKKSGSKWGINFELTQNVLRIFLRIFGIFWEFSNVFGSFWKFSGVFGSFWEFLSYYLSFFEIENFYKFSEILK